MVEYRVVIKLKDSKEDLLPFGENFYEASKFFTDYIKRLSSLPKGTIEYLKIQSRESTDWRG